MRDINKIKEFSVKDYTARPTLLAEADSRRMAKKNMPGLGGTTCHSFQPEVQPQLTPASQQPYHAQTAQRGQHAPYHHSDRDRDRVEHHEHVRSSRKPDMSRRRTSPRMSNYDDDSYEDVSLSSGRSNRRYYGDSRGGSRNAKMQSHHGHRQRSSNPRRNHYDRAGSVYNSDYEDHPHGREFRKANPLSSLRNRRGIDRCRRDYHEDRHYDCYDYEEFSDDYFSDEFDEWSDDRYSERFGSSAGAAKGGLKRRTAQRRAQGDARASRDKDYDREARWRGPLRSNGKGGVHHGGRSRPAVPVVNLDDPRNNNDVLPRSAHRSRRGSISGDSDFSEKARNAKPRSQFGRMLANIKRQAAPGSPRAESESQNAAESKGSEKTDNLPKSESLKEEIDKENVNNSTGTEANANAEPEIHSAAATTPVTAPVAVA
ncbi:hypothetical protein FB639_003423 [Coemansia asiatica]|nr:hypothetical protein FB639_003423 [Coemansia asiatica]